MRYFQIACVFAVAVAENGLLRKNRELADEKQRLFIDFQPVIDHVSELYGTSEPTSTPMPSPPPTAAPFPALQFLGDDVPPDGFEACQGDCDRHSDCKGELMCADRRDDEPVIGCSGAEGYYPGKDFCYDPNTPSPTLSPSAAPSMAEPTVSPMPSAAPTTGFPTMSPSSFPTGTTLITLDDSRKPFNKCEGDCEDDDDCRGDLKCQERGGYEPVPGCDGLGDSGTSYCYDKNDGPTPPMLPGGSFRLRLYWEREYFWQETHEETFWCFDSWLGEGSWPRIRACKKKPSQMFHFVYLPTLGDMIKVKDQNLCMELSSRRNVTYEKCDESNHRQRWTGDWTGRRFDIRPAFSQGCLTQHHHPKGFEIVRLEGCDKAHIYNTGFWKVY